MAVQMSEGLLRWALAMHEDNFHATQDRAAARRETNGTHLVMTRRDPKSFKRRGVDPIG